MSSFSPIEPSNDYLTSDQVYSQPEFHLPLDEQDERVEDEQLPSRQFNFLTIFTLGIILLLGLQCFRLQVTQGESNRSQAEGNSLRIITIPADRGLITDINGTVLAQNSKQEALAINPLTLPAKRADRLPIYALLQQKAGLSNEKINFIESNRLKTPEIFAVKTNLSKDESLLYKEWFASTPGVVIKEIPIRTYTELPSLGQIIGYVGSPSNVDLQKGATPDEQLGKSGLEQVYNTPLSGVPGREKAEVDAYGQIIRSLSSGTDALPQAGQTLKLSLDSKLQQITATALQHELARRTKQYGSLPDLGASAIIMDPNSGAIKAMVSLPDYSSNIFATGISSTDFNNLLNDPGKPLLNRAIQGQYPPGSTIKPSLFAAALQNGIITADTQMVTGASISVAGSVFPDWTVHGLTNVRKAIAESNDIFAYEVGGGYTPTNFKGLGIDRMNQYWQYFGFGQPLGVDLPGEAAGFLGTPAWKEQTLQEPWYIGDTYHAAIGQGFTTVTPLQMVTAISAIANGGTVWKPHLLEATIDPNTGKSTQLNPVSLKAGFISPQNIEIIREGMRQTVLSGSARPINTLKVTSAGKTGTAEFGNKGLTHAWYTGFAPYDNPTIAFAIVIEGGGDSFYSALPVAEEILRAYFNDPLPPGQKLNSEPDLSNVNNSAFHGEH